MSVFVCAAAALAWKGVIPGHVFLVMGGAILGYAVPRQGGQGGILPVSASALRLEGSKAPQAPQPPQVSSTPPSQGKTF